MASPAPEWIANESRCPAAGFPSYERRNPASRTYEAIPFIHGWIRAAGRANATAGDRGYPRPPYCRRGRTMTHQDLLAQARRLTGAVLLLAGFCAMAGAPPPEKQPGCSPVCL